MAKQEKKNVRKEVGEPKQPFWKRSAFQYAVIVVLVFVQYAQTASFDYALDDTIFITNNSKVQKGWKDIPALFENSWGGSSEERTGYRPITLLSFATDIQFFGMNPKPSHIINMLLYALGCVLLLRLLSSMFPQQQWLVFLITVLYAVHPLHTEVVANIKSRDELLAMIFGILFIHAHIKFLKQGPIWLLIIAPLLYFLATLSKESAITFIGVSTAIALFWQEAPWKIRLMSVGSTVVAIGLLAGTWLYVYSDQFFQDNTEELRQMGTYSYDAFVGNALADIDSKVMIWGNSAAILWQSVKMFFWPHPLVHDYSFNQLPILVFFWNSPRFWLGLLSLLILGIMALYGFRKKSMFTIGAAWFIVTISVYLSVAAPASDIFAERFLFFPSIGLCLIVGGILERIPNFDFKKQTMVVGILTVPLLMMSVKRAPAWENSQSLLEDDIDKLENCVRANYNYALLLHQKYDKFPEKRKRGDEQQILKHYQLALDQTDRLSNLYLAMGNAYMRFGLREKGRETFLAYAKAYPQLSKPFTQLGNYYGTSDQLDSAVYYFNKAVEVGRLDPDNHLKLGLAYFNAGQIDKALEAMEAGEQYAAQSVEYYQRYTIMCIKADLYQRAYEVAGRGLSNFPNDAKLLDMKHQLEAARR